MDETGRVYVSRFSCFGEDAARRLVNGLLVSGLDPELHPPRLPGRPWEVAAAALVEPVPGGVADLEAAMREAAERAGAAFEGCAAEPHEVRT